ncbi:MAG: hypothetical protein C5B53_04115 [Candidatus Melainabacteria bacterium]|nr:MAG: hypothetical protein C5B53_04115 [Candidatus Melainabacteria bacterium]
MTGRTPQIHALVFVLLFSATMNLNSEAIAVEVPSIASRNHSKPGDVLVRVQNHGSAKTVVGTIEIDQSPHRIWPILVNPYELQASICPRMKEIEMLCDEPNTSLMKVKVDCGIFFPHISYIVESKYTRNQRIDFRRIGGTLKDFTGYWQIEPLDDGSRSRVTYSLFIEPGIPVPQWLVREAIKVELPKTLRALRRRVDYLCEGNHKAISKTILAAKPLD